MSCLSYSFAGMVPVVDPSAYVHPTAVLIGDVRIGANCFIGPGASLRGDFSSVIVGAGSNIQDQCTLHGTPGFPTIVEEMGHVGHGAVVHGCHVGRNALVGMGAAIYDGARIGEGAVIAAKAFVPADFEVPPFMLVAGVPARVLRPLTQAEIARKTRGTEAYQELARQCHESLRPCQPLTAPEPGRDGMDPSSLWPTDLSRPR
jgi:phenylacetic acid degradation protein